MSSTLVLSLLSAAFFTAAGVVLIRRQHRLDLSGSVLIPMLLSIFLYGFIVVSNLLEHSGITNFFDPYEDLAEIVFTLVFLFFVNNWRKGRSETRFKELFKLAPMPLAEVAKDGRIIEINEILAKKLFEFFEVDSKDVPTLDDWWRMAYPDPERRQKIISEWKKTVDKAYQTGAEISAGERHITCKDGTRRTLIASAGLIGENLLLSMIDITDRKREEAARMENLELLRATFNATPDGILVVDQQLKVTQANQQFYKMWRIPDKFQEIDDDAALREFILDQIDDPVSYQNMVDGLYHSRVQDVYEIAFKDGRAFECYTAPMVLQGDEIGRVWNFRDISKQKQAEADQEKLLNQLNQSQKLEAIGILAGGVAHDFNNILGAIMGYAELTLEGMDAGDPFRANIAKILDATRRCVGLTRQLLIFARKDTITPMVIDLNTSVENMLIMLRRLIGENIELNWVPTESRCTVKMDPSQLDQIVVNLCVNAREAIPDIGRITIESETVSFDDNKCKPHIDCEPGEYVRLKVMDNGRGMEQEVAQHVFEPFFTTKGLGQGTGLGLSTVYGIIKKSGGFINLHSEPGMGTTFKIYIPLHMDKTAPQQGLPSEAVPLSQGETILMVEDDPFLIETNRMMLERLGYKVLTATTPGEAIQLAAESNGEIHLFLTDVVMPEMNGRELIDRLLELRPNVRYLFMSGYTADVIIHRGVLEKRKYFIQKPFSLKDIAVKIREVLDTRSI